jgi:hypothetical protein
MGHGYSFVVIDPEGDYEGLPGAVTLGTSERPPSMEEAMQLFERRENVALNLIGLQLADRPSFFLKLLPELLALRNRTGQPHLVVIDEAHHLLPAASQAAEQAWPERQDGVVLITVHPDKVTPRAMKGADAVIVIGKEPAGTLGRLTQCTGQAFDVQAAEPDLEPGEALVWARGEAPVPQRLKLVPSRTEHRRHVRKYAEGELPPDRCFYFRGAEDQLNLRAQNLILFLQIADGVDDATWLHHLKRGDYSRWFAEGIKNDELAAEARRVEAMSELSPQQSRALIREAIERVYTLPA